MTERIDKWVTVYKGNLWLWLNQVISYKEEIRDTTQSMVEMSSLELARNVLQSNEIYNYYDLYFIKIEDFRQILTQNNLLDYYKEITWEAVSKISSKWILRFWKNLCYNKISVKEIKDYISEKLKSESITSINELIIFWLNNFKQVFWDDNILKYYFKKWKKKSLVNLDFEDYIMFWYDLNLEEVNVTELKKSVIHILNENKIKYSDDLLAIDVIDFKKIVGNNPLLEYYFVYVKKIQKSFILKDDIEKVWIELWLTEKPCDKNKEIQEFLKTNGVINFNDLNEYKLTEMRSMLWENQACRIVLNELWLFQLENYRFDHLKRFARRVGLDWVPKDIEYNEERAKKSLQEVFKSIWVNCLYWLNFYWIKKFERFLIKEKSLFYKDINTFIKTKTGKVLSTMHSSDFEKLWIELWLPENLSEIEYKNKLLEFLSKKWLSLDSINKTYVKENSNIWFDINFRYFMEKVWLKSDIKKLRPNHIDDLKEYIWNINQ